MRRSLTLDPGCSALVLVDLQEEQRRDGEYNVEDIDAVLTNAQAVLQAARARRLLVVHAAYCRDFNKVPQRPLEFLTPDGKPAFSAKESLGTAICAEVAPRADEPVIQKNDASAFSEGELAPLLRLRNIEWVIVCGVWTEACIAATVRDAIAHGFRVLLVKDACGSGTRCMHQTGILNLANRLAGGAVADTSAAVRLVAGEAVEVWVTEKPVPILFGYNDAETLYQAL